jgi:hypothetical protein
MYKTLIIGDSQYGIDREHFMHHVIKQNQYFKLCLKNTVLKLAVLTKLVRGKVMILQPVVDVLIILLMWHYHVQLVHTM